MHDTVRKYMAEVGSRGGSRNTEAQREARSRSLARAREKRWPKKVTDGKK